MARILASEAARRKGRGKGVEEEGTWVKEEDKGVGKEDEGAKWKEEVELWEQVWKWDIWWRVMVGGAERKLSTSNSKLGTHCSPQARQNIRYLLADRIHPVSDIATYD